MKPLLLYGYGNRGRQDDGLGPMLCDKLEGAFPELDVDENFQLNIEDAETIGQYRTVIFADANADTSADRRKAVTLQKISPDHQIHFSTHTMHPASILALCQELFDRVPESYLLTMQGYGWEFGEDLTPDGKSNLEKAEGLLRLRIKDLLGPKNGLDQSVDTVL